MLSCADSFQRTNVKGWLCQPNNAKGEYLLASQRGFSIRYDFEYAPHEEMRASGDTSVTHDTCHVHTNDFIFVGEGNHRLPHFASYMKVKDPSNATCPVERPECNTRPQEIVVVSVESIGMVKQSDERDER